MALGLGEAGGKKVKDGLLRGSWTFGEKDGKLVEGGCWVGLVGACLSSWCSCEGVGVGVGGDGLGEVGCFSCASVG